MIIALLSVLLIAEPGGGMRVSPAGTLGAPSVTMPEIPPEIPPDTVPRGGRAAAVVADSVAMATAFDDPGARALLERARARQDSSDNSILAYRALARQRLSVTLSTLRRERLLYRRENSARIHWRRYGRLEVDLLGAREVAPIALPGAKVPDDLERDMPRFLFDPSSHHLFVESDVDKGEGDDRADGLRHPLAPGSEAHYRFASGDSTLITLPDGRTLRLLELRLTPRRADPHLLTGSLWLEAESYAVVQGVFRLARAFDLERDLDDDDADDIRKIPGILKPIRADLQYLTVDYGLWEMRWWLPRVVAFEGYASAGSLLRVPVRFELAYSEYEIFADPVQLPLDLPLPPTVMTLAGDTFPRPTCRPGAECRCIRGECRRVEVRIPEDSSLILNHPTLPASVYSDGPELIDDDEIRAIRSRLSHTGAPTEFVGPRLYWGLDRPGLLRYNRVEGLSTALRLGAEYGRLTGDITARLAWADLRRPGLALGVRWEGQRYGARLGAYRELVALEPAVHPFGLANSLQSLLWGRDEGDYLRALGVDLGGGPAPGTTTRLDWRLYAERHTPVENRTWTTLRRLWSRKDPFRPNLQADTAELLGAALDLRLTRGFDPVGVRWGALLSLEGATGSHQYLRPSATFTLSGPLPGGLIGALEGAAGSSVGEVPLQRSWFLGGAPTLRGYAPLTLAGTAFWRTRLEVGTRVPAGRIVVFSDLGWAGARERFPGGEYLAGAGVGASFLDGLLRLDLARALRTPTGWRFSVASDLGL